jgi:hypothetical protein
MPCSYAHSLAYRARRPAPSCRYARGNSAPWRCRFRWAHRWRLPAPPQQTRGVGPRRDLLLIGVRALVKAVRQARSSRVLVAAGGPLSNKARLARPFRLGSRSSLRSPDLTQPSRQRSEGGEAQGDLRAKWHHSGINVVGPTPAAALAVNGAPPRTDGGCRTSSQMGSANVHPN